KPISEDNLKEMVGHKPIEVMAGLILGIITAVCFLAF
ncbi:MAG: divergent PAP2 family protein, partial [Clostridia bacterium]|nr:divergent PAP2 family protein [Clostridia bacterium]